MAAKRTLSNKDSILDILDRSGISVECRQELLETIENYAIDNRIESRNDEEVPHMITAEENIAVTDTPNEIQDTPAFRRRGGANDLTGRQEVGSTVYLQRSLTKSLNYIV